VKTDCVLVIESNEITQMIIASLLESRGTVVIIANHGVEALLTIDAVESTLVLMNLDIPISEGIAAIQSIRSQERYERLPIIGLTTDIIKEQNLFYQAGINDIVTKPIDAELFLHKISKWFRQPNSAEQIPEALADLPSPSSQAIDMQQALHRINGKTHLLKHLLLQFRTDFSDARGKLNDLLETNEIPAARRLIHTLRGASANLSANRVYAAASRLEEDLLNTTVLEEQALVELELALHELEIFIHLFVES
jgi:two-component system sensor histidine kinase/response regulator